MKSLLVFALGLLLAVHSLHARLGENEDQLKERYGDPTNPTDKEDNHILKRIYEYKGVTITVTFLNKKSASEEYEGLATRDAVETILVANAGSFAWKIDAFTPRDPTGQALPSRWTLYSPAKSIATASYESATLTIATFELLDFMTAQQNAGNLKGF